MRPRYQMPSLYCTIVMESIAYSGIPKIIAEMDCMHRIPPFSIRRKPVHHLPGDAAALCHCGILLLETVAQPLGALHVLVDAPHDAALFARCEGFALEAVDAVVEALLDEVGVHLG